MPENKRQLHRLIRLVAELKENRYPNTISFSNKLKQLDISENLALACTPKTVQRDIRTLKEEFNAPIEYDQERKGYYLRHHGWNFQCPVFEEHEILASILGARVAEDLFPNPVRQEIRQATDYLLTENNPDFLDTAYIQSLIVASGLQVAIDSTVFMTVFEAWQRHVAVNICYRAVNHEESERKVEPHVLAFKDAAWFIKGYCHKRQSSRTFAVHRILSAELTDEEFEPDKTIIEGVKAGLLFDYQKVSNVVIECERSLLPYVREKMLHSQQKIVENGETFDLTIPSASEYDVTNWIFTQQGRAWVKSPSSLRETINTTAQRIAETHGK